MKILIAILMIFSASLVFVPLTLAHVVVKPNEVGAGTIQTFTVSVPNEKDIPTVEIRLVLPPRLENVLPSEKPGWTVDVKKAGKSMKGEILNTGERAPDPETVTEIIWTGGSISKGQSDDFSLSAKVPATTGELTWLSYQTYSDGTVVAWDQDPGQQSNDNIGPYSKTTIVDRPNPSHNEHVETSHQTVDKTNLPLIILVIAILLASFFLGMRLRKK